jgi:AraC family transcriptional regulator of adaptative response/methylated-DNA-[protein]-cysteine methyltransferase
MNTVRGKTHFLRTRVAKVAETDPRWAALVARDPAADGRFFYSVKTTGVYCRPSCAARLARPENVRFHATRAAAERAGFRACRRCRPDQPVRTARWAKRKPATRPAIGASKRTPEVHLHEDRSMGAGDAIRFAIDVCSLGSILVAASERGICSILIGDDPDALQRELQGRFPQATPIGDDAAFRERVAQVGLVDTPGQEFDLPLDMRGTAFQQRVWKALRGIPAGTTASYRDIAGRIGAPGSARAVARACASNTIAVAVPCHRVVRGDGGLSGYRWGVERKRALLDREAMA